MPSDGLLTSDLLPPSTRVPVPAACRLVSAMLQDIDTGPVLRVDFEAVAEAAFFSRVLPLPLLRANSVENVHTSTLQRLAGLSPPILGTRAESVQVEHAAQGGSDSDVRVRWAGPPLEVESYPGRFLPDESLFSAGWLLQHGVKPVEDGEGAESGRSKAKSSDVAGLVMPTFSRSPSVVLAMEQKPTLAAECLAQRDAAAFPYQKILDCDETLLKLIRRLWSNGLVFVKDVPEPVGGEEPGPDSHLESRILALQRRVGVPRWTNYGLAFHVKSSPVANNQAYTTQELALHTDLPFYNRPPEIQMLHCVRNSPETPSGGGQSTFSDGLAAAYVLRDEAPALYEALRTTPVQFSDWSPDNEFQMHAEQVVIQESASSPGVVDRVHLNEGVRCHYLPSCSSAQDIQLVYEGISALRSILLRPELLVEAKLRPGELCIWNNNRTLHGRRAFKDDGSYGRHLVGGYVDWDDVHSRRRVLEAKLRAEEPTSRL